MNVHEALAAVPRVLFIPDEIFVLDESGWLVPLRRGDDPERWQEHVAADDAIVTRTAFDPSVPPELRDATTGRGVEATSSSSAPFIMARVLDALKLASGMRVLEIGTGTGYNAAVLAHLAGADNVISVELDPVAADRARQALQRAGFPVRVATGDGEDGYPPGAPYDRIVVTASAHTVPPAWVEQTRPGGMILVPWAPTVHPDWPLCRLTVRSDGIAEGRFLGPSPFMPLHGQRVDVRTTDEAERRWKAAGEPDCTRYGVTVTPEGQELWLDSPDNIID
ncbi:methyltransferase domain-containing protein [Actinomadura fibrosa]|uniref:Protein-L-isoaspartate O-methyltransferase n=1 Tax=Actinomadura fibrosa TaxID=111802 RepID=A0ABW2XR42_9ACTN|nr:methyltransferase domain-containing protein [Actinomadura fibrosa]